MIKLHPETAQQIATLINSTRVNNSMAIDDAKNTAYWMASEYRNIIELAEEFGIILPSYGLAKENLEKPHYRDATYKI